MPIRPKHLPGEGRPVAARQFTDRADFINSFRSALVGKQPDKHQVLVFYGVGGIGKTCLRKELTRQLESDPGVVTGALDFDVPGFRDEETALFVLRKILRDRYKVQFHSFDIAYTIHWQKTRPQTTMTSQNFPLLESGTLLSDALEVLGNLTVIGTIPRIAGIALKGGKAVRGWWLKRGSAELRDLPQLEPSQIAERLPMFWASDLKDFLAAKGGKAVLFLDTYEALTETERSEGKLHQQDEWVRELVAQLPEVLWVVCGREMLRWAELDSDWRESLSQHLVGGLADEDARQFLKTCGIEDRTIVDTIVQGSTGLPYYLDLAVDTYLEAGRRGVLPKPGDFAHTPAEVFTRFLRHLTQGEIETLKVLAIPRFWDVELFESLVTRFNTGYPLTAFSDLCRFSFINTAAEPDVCTMQQLMRQSLQEHASQELVKRVHRMLFEFYAGRLEGTNVRSVTDRDRTALSEAFYHGRAVLPVQEFFQWFQKPAEQFYRAAQWQLLVPLYGQVERDLEKDLGPDHPDVADALSFEAGALYKRGEYAEAEARQRRVLAVREKTPDTEPTYLAESLNNLAAMLNAQGKYAEAEPLYRRSLAIVGETHGPAHPNTAFPMDNLAVTLHCQGKYAEAEPLYRRSLAAREETLGPEHPDVAKSMNNLAELLFARGSLAEAEPLYRRALAIREKALGPDHPAVARSLDDLAELLLAKGIRAEAEPLARRSLAIREGTLGREHPDTARSLTTLADLLQSDGKCAEAETLHRRALAVRENALGPGHVGVAQSQDRLAGLLSAKGEYVEAELLFRRALATEERVLGLDHPELAKTLKGLADLCAKTGRDDEAGQIRARMKALPCKQETAGS